MVEGGCLCGAVRWQVEGPLRHITHCHCGMCRKAHGAAFATYARVGKKRFRFLAGDDVIVRYRSSESVTRSFCPRCGSSLFWGHDETPDVVEIAVGTVDGDPIGRPEGHIFVKDKACWVEIRDDLPRYDGNPPLSA